MNYRTATAFRILFISTSALLFVGAEGVWHAMGYLNKFAWFLEWSDIFLAFLNVYLATRSGYLRSKLMPVALLTVSFALVVLSYAPALNLSVLTSLGPPYYVIYSIPLLATPFFIMGNGGSEFNRSRFSLLFFILVLSSLMVVTYLFYVSSPQFPTDELTLDLYSAHLFLQGLNPYSPGITVGAFSYYNFPLYFNTPILTGGYVQSLTYPALSFIFLMPATLLHIKSSLIMLPFFAVPITLVWYRAYSRKEWLLSMLVLLPFLCLTIYTAQVTLADDNIIWVSLLMFSYYALPKSRTSGALFGLALSVKQFPIIIAPFLLYFIIKEYGRSKAVSWFVFGLVTFLCINGYFIINNPGSFVSAMLSNELTPLLGVGLGPSQLSFLGYASIQPIVYTTAMFSVLLISLIIYTTRYNHLKYALFAFPIIILLFNYRLFIQYVFYWMVISLLPLVDVIGRKGHEVSFPVDSELTASSHSRTKTKAAIAFVVGIMLIFSALGYYEVSQSSTENFAINSIHYVGYNSSGYVDKIIVNLTYNGKIENGTTVLFRIVTPTPVDNVNMLLWKPVNNVTLYPNQSLNVEIIPDYSVYALPVNTSYRMIAYYGDIQGSLEVT